MKNSLFPQSMYINGSWIDRENKISVYNPATGEIMGSVPDGTELDAKEAVEAAYNSGPEWSKLTAEERSAKLQEWSRLIENI